MSDAMQNTTSSAEKQHNLFTRHPASVNETYFEHMLVALSFSGKFFFGAIAALIHAFFPFLFEKTGSNLIAKMHDRMVSNRVTKAAREE